jgi:hypothetical protein
MAFLRRKGGSKSAIEEARQAIAQANGGIQELRRRREEALLSEDDRAVDAIDADLDKLEKIARRHADRARLLEAEAQREEAERTAARRRDVIPRVEKKLRESEGVAAELQEAIARTERAFRRLIDLRTAAAAALSFDANQLATCLVSVASVRLLVQHEIFRVGCRPFVGGQEFELVAPSLPGGRAPDPLRQPDQVTPLVEALRQATEHAISLMRGNLVAAVEAEPPAEAA